MEFNLREYQLYVKTILDRVTAICDRHNLTYFLSSGTLLGAVRHQGFIPWDDDIDIDMPIKDYHKLCKIPASEFEKEGLFFQTYDTDPKAALSWAMVRANGTTSMPLAEYTWDIHWGIHVDIFPLIGLYKNKLLRKLQFKLFGVSRQLLQKDHDDLFDQDRKVNRGIKLLTKLPRKARHTLVHFFDLFIDKDFYSSEEGSIKWCRLRACYCPSCFKEKTKVLFENTWYTAPADYDKALTMAFGDYMTPPPPEKRGGHDKKQGSTIRDFNKDYREYKKELSEKNV